MENVESVWCVLFIPVLVVRHIISYPDSFFLSIWECVGRVCATVLLRCSDLSRGHWRKMWEGIFVSNSNYATGF